MTDVFVNSNKIFTGTRGKNFSFVLCENETIYNSIEDPIIAINSYNFSFDHENNLNTPMGWQGCYGRGGEYKGDYTIYAPVQGSSIKKLSPTFIMVSKPEEMVITAMETHNVTRKTLQQTLEEIFLSEKFGVVGSKNVWISRSVEKRAAILIDKESQMNVLVKLLEELNTELLIDNGEFDVIEPERTYDNRLGFYAGKWYAIERIPSSESWYKVLEEIETVDGKAKYTLTFNDGTMKVASLNSNGDYMISSYTITNLLLG